MDRVMDATDWTGKMAYMYNRQNTWEGGEHKHKDKITNE